MCRGVSINVRTSGRRWGRSLAILLIGALLLTACPGDEDDDCIVPEVPTGIPSADVPTEAVCPEEPSESESPDDGDGGGLLGLVDCDGEGIREALIADNDDDGDIDVDDCPDELIDCGDGILRQLTDANGDGRVDEDDCRIPGGDEFCSISELLAMRDQQIVDTEEPEISGMTQAVNCLFDEECGTGQNILGLDDFDGDGFSNAFEILFADVTGGDLDPCEADSDGDGIDDAVDLVRENNSEVLLVDMAIVKYTQDDCCMDDPGGDGDPYFWSGSWLKASNDSEVPLRFNQFTFDNHAHANTSSGEDTDEWEPSSDEYTSPKFLEQPVELSASLGDWVTDADDTPSILGSLIVLDHDGDFEDAFGNRDGSDCEASLYIPSEPTFDRCDATGEPDATGILTSQPNYGSLTVSLVGLLLSIWEGDAVGGSVFDLASRSESGTYQQRDREEAPSNGQRGLDFPLFTIRFPGEDEDKLAMDAWIGIADSTGAPINPCTLTTALDVLKLDVLDTGNVFLPDDWDPSCRLATGRPAPSPR